MRLTPEERETIILFSDADTEANVYTHDVKLIARLKKLAKQYPDQVYEEREEHEGAVSYMMLGTGPCNGVLHLPNGDTNPIPKWANGFCGGLYCSAQMPFHFGIPIP